MESNFCSKFRVNLIFKAQYLDPFFLFLPNIYSRDFPAETVTFYLTLYTCSFILSVILQCLVYILLIALKIISLNRLKANPEKFQFMTLVWVKEIE